MMCPRPYSPMIPGDVPTTLIPTNYLSPMLCMYYFNQTSHSLKQGSHFTDKEQAQRD